MDLAMIMGVTLFAMFTGSTVYFLYKVPRWGRVTAPAWTA